MSGSTARKLRRACARRGHPLRKRIALSPALHHLVCVDCGHDFGECS